MGKYNSSKTRVEPVFNALLKMDPTGRRWLRRLMLLGSRAGVVPELGDIGELLPSHPSWWGRNERVLRPPPALLRWLVRNAAAPVRPHAWGSPSVKRKRQRLVARDERVIGEALRRLDEGRPRRAWYVLEGESRPDACLDTERILLVIEGKRTESGATTSTAWMSVRSQILRHMDAAIEVSEKRRVLGMMVVEDPVEPTAVDWHAEAEDQIAPSMLRGSLPHRTGRERKALVSGFLGVTTWQRVCRELGLPLLERSFGNG